DPRRALGIEIHPLEVPGGHRHELSSRRLRCALPLRLPGRLRQDRRRQPETHETRQDLLALHEPSFFEMKLAKGYHRPLFEEIAGWRGRNPSYSPRGLTAVTQI